MENIQNTGGRDRVPVYVYIYIYICIHMDVCAHRLVFRPPVLSRDLELIQKAANRQLSMNPAD